jgi:hypothetical protein
MVEGVVVRTLLVIGCIGRSLSCCWYVGYKRNTPNGYVRALAPVKDCAARDCHLCIACIVDV